MNPTTQVTTPSIPDEDPDERALAALYNDIGATGIMRSLRELIARNAWLERTHRDSMYVIEEFCERGEIIADLRETLSNARTDLETESNYARELEIKIAQLQAERDRALAIAKQTLRRHTP